MQHPISITAISSASPLGSNPISIWENYLNNQHCILRKNFNDEATFVATLSDEYSKEIKKLQKTDKHYNDLDRSVLMAILTARKAIKTANWKSGDFGINIGSSRGATALFEKHHQDFLERNKVMPSTSPTTTLGNISSWIAHDLQSSGPTISHSINFLV